MSQVDKNEKPLAIAIMGPTAAGKTHLAIELSKLLNGDIISVDSALIYRDMNIGTAKPSLQEQKEAPHRLIDIVDPSEPYSVASFCRSAEHELDLIVTGGRIPILVGGTMMYFKSLLEGLSPMPASQSAVRLEIEAIAKTHGWQEIHRRLQLVDPISASKIHPNHSHRLSRALEVYLISNKTMSYWQAQPKDGVLDKYNWVQIAVSVQDRKVLHDRIAQRFKLMLEQGFVEEVKSLFNRGDLHKDMASIRCVGYRQVWEMLEGLDTFDTMTEKGIAATRQLAKRQLTWLRSWENLNWLYTDTYFSGDQPVDEIVQKALKIVKSAHI